jgi:cytochrome P450
MTSARPDVSGVPVIVLTDPAVLRDPFTAYARARELSPVAQLRIPRLGAMWALTRHEGVRAMLADPRFAVTADSFIRPDVPEDCQNYMRTTLMDGPDHVRLRRLVAPAFGRRRVGELRAQVELAVEKLLDELPDHVELGAVDLVRHFAQPLPIDVMCALVGIPEANRPRWREYGAAVAAGSGRRFADAWPGMLEGARAAVARHRAEPADDLVCDLLRAHGEDGDRLTETELVTLVWLLVIAGQTTNVVANAVHALLCHPEQLAALRAEPGLMPGAVDELIRWGGSTLLTMPRYAREDLELYGVRVRPGERVTAAVAAADRDPRVFADPDRLDITRDPGPSPHLGFACGPHACLGAALGRAETEVALSALWRRYPDLALAAPARELVRVPDPGTWRLASLPVRL